jgi:hypothetical protein
MTTVTVVVGGRPVGKAPFGFGAHYAAAWKDPAKPEVLRDILELVGWTASVEAIAAWPMLRRVEAEVYAARVHLRASDNPVRVPPRPKWMGEPWRGPRSLADGIVHAPEPTVLP